MRHDAHGISSAQGAAVNHTRLLNFDTSIVTPNRNGVLEHVDLGFRTGSCALTCHKHNHRPATY